MNTLSPSPRHVTKFIHEELLSQSPLPSLPQVTALPEYHWWRPFLAQYRCQESSLLSEAWAQTRALKWSRSISLDEAARLVDFVSGPKSPGARHLTGSKTYQVRETPDAKHDLTVTSALGRHKRWDPATPSCHTCSWRWCPESLTTSWVWGRPHVSKEVLVKVNDDVSPTSRPSS